MTLYNPRSNVIEVSDQGECFFCHQKFGPSAAYVEWRGTSTITLHPECSAELGLHLITDAGSRNVPSGFRRIVESEQPQPLLDPFAPGEDALKPIVAKLDELDVPTSWSRVRTRTFLERYGFMVDNVSLTDAMRIRRERPA